MLIGNNHNEAGIVSGFALMAVDAAKGQKNLPKVAEQAISLVNWLKDGTGFMVDTVRKILHFVEDGVFNCPAASAAAARARAGVPVWRYRYMGTFENTLIAGQGAYHLAEVPIVMGTSGRKSKDQPNTPDQDETIKNVMTAWAAFAKDPDHG